MRKHTMLLIGVLVSLSLLAEDYVGEVKADKKGVPNVIVSNGFDVVKTDSKGKYVLPYHKSSKFIFITVPADCEIPHHNGLFDAFKKIKEDTKTYNFSLKKRKNRNDNYTLFVFGDPLLWTPNNTRNFEKKIIQDMIDYKKKLSKETTVYGIALGDLIGGSNELRFQDFKTAMSQTYFTFFTAIGDNDHNREASDAETAKEIYEKNIGPRYYGFNLGKFHIIMLDDIKWEDKKYTAAIDDDQMNWLRQYLKQIPENSNLIVCLHIPVLRRRSKPENLTNAKDFLTLLSPYNVHFFSSHLGYIENYRQARQKRHQHTHAVTNGVLNTFEMNKDGTPNGYAVYELNGDSISWYYKALSRNKNYQMSVSEVGAHPDYPGKIIVNIWNWDENWKINVMEDDKPMESPDRVVDYALEFKYGAYKIQTNKYRMPVKTYHLFVIAPSNGAKKITVEAIDPFGTKYIKELNIY